jgi:hypothetical protein
MTAGLEAERHEPRDNYDGTENRQREQLGERTGRSKDQRCAQRDEIARHMSRKESLQSKISCGIDVSGIEAQYTRK